MSELRCRYGGGFQSGWCLKLMFRTKRDAYRACSQIDENPGGAHMLSYLGPTREGSHKYELPVFVSTPSIQDAIRWLRMVAGIEVIGTGGGGEYKRQVG